MRFSIKYSLIGILIFLATCVQAEDILYKCIKLNLEETSVDSALKLIEQELDYYFIYNSELIKDRPEISADFSNFPLSLVLDSLFNNPFLEYKILDKQIVIYKNRNKVVAAKNKNSDKIVEHKTFKGKVIDKAENKAIPYASVSILNKSAGTVSNLDGEFSLNIHEKYFEDTLAISHIGYEPILLNVSELDTISTIQLQAKTVSLQEIFIRWQNPRELLNRALKASKDNYPSNPSQLRTFYRESLKRNNKYMLYVEGLLDVYKGGYRPTLFKDQAKLLQLRKFTNVESADTVLFRLQGGIDASIALDLLREPLNFVDRGELHNYNYMYEGIEAFNDREVHKISFVPNTNNPFNDYKGNIFICSKSLAIIKIQFSLIKQNAKKLANNFVLRSKPSIKVIPRSINYEINYKEIEGKHYINHISGNMNLKVKRKRKLIASSYKIHFEMITTDISTTDVKKFKRRERVKPRLILTDLRKSYVKNINKYWGNDNFILPENDLIRALEKFEIEELTYNGSN